MRDAGRVFTPALGVLFTVVRRPLLAALTQCVKTVAVRLLGAQITVVAVARCTVVCQAAGQSFGDGDFRRRPQPEEGIGALSSSSHSSHPSPVLV